MFNTMKDTVPTLVIEMFLLKEENRYELRYCTDFAIATVNSARNGLEGLSYLELKIWETLPLGLKQSKSLSEFKSKSNKWKPQNCPCRLCKVYKIYTETQLES